MRLCPEALALSMAEASDQAVSSRALDQRRCREQPVGREEMQESWPASGTQRNGRRH